MSALLVFAKQTNGQNKLLWITLLKIFFFSYSLSSGTDCSRKNLALSVAAAMMAVGKFL